MGKSWDCVDAVPLGPGQRMDAAEPGRTRDPQASTSHGAQQRLESLSLSDTYVLLK